MQLDTLYKRTKTGAIQYWSVKTSHFTPHHSVITKEAGQLGTTSPVIHNEDVTEGKNLGKANATTPEQQADLQARSDWNKKRDEGYKSLIDLGLASEDAVKYSDLAATLDALLPQFNTDASGNVKPMLATDWNKVKNIKYPVLVQPKLDGVRCLMLIYVGFTSEGPLHKVVFLSRSGKEYTTLGHIAEDVRKADFGPYAEPEEGYLLILDGEIYSDELTFQEITQAVKKQYPNSLKLHFRAYDCVHEDGQEDRVVAHTANLVKAISSPFVHLVPHQWADDAEEVKALHNSFVQDGYEGAMIRIPDGKYERGCRSRSLLKVKEFDETEFTMLELVLGQREEDLLVLCKTSTGQEFRAKMIGSREEKELIKGKLGIKKYIGDRKITIKHFGWTEDRLPRFPIGKAIRDYE